MAAQDIRIEIVPLPDAATVEPVSDPVVAPDSSASESDPDIEPPMVETDRTEGVGRERAAQAAPVVAATQAVPAEVARDDGPLRTASIAGRLLLLTLGAVIVTALVVLAAVWGITRVSDAGRDLAELGSVESVVARAHAELRLVGADPSPDSADLRSLEAASLSADEASRSWVAAAVADGARDTTSAYVAAVTAERPAQAELADAMTARDRLDAEVADARRSVADRAESARTSAIGILIAVLLAALVALLLMGRVVARSIVVPLRSVGRSLRRFGDGDLRSRAPVAGDELGTFARSFNAMADSVSERLEHLHAMAERDAQLRMVNDALDLADREGDVYRILEQALAILTPDSPGELLVNEPTSSRLWQVSTNPVAGPGGCPVETADGCPAMRRAQALTFESPSAINSCPHLRSHATPCSAACVPVGVNGHLLGVVHVTAPEHEPPSSEVVEQLVTLAGQVGVRVGAQRTLETTRLQASTDGLTGLANRRMLEARLGDLMRGKVSFALAVADVDRFKHLNDTYGHELGDRALQLFAKVLEDNVRGHDVVARYGGEEFVLVYPELSVKKAMEVIERIRLALERAIDAAGLPPFTCSFGVTHSSAADTVDGIIRIADAGLLMAKDLGRNRVVFADLDLAAEVFGGGESGSGPASPGEDPVTD